MDESKTIKKLLEEYYQLHPEFGEQGGVSKTWFWIDIGFFKLPIPNLKGRQELVYMHDIHHILNGYNTNWSGEAAVSGWEIATGLGKGFTGWFYASLGFLVGILIRPVCVIKGFRRGLKTKGVLQLGLSKEKLLSMSLSEVKALTGHDKLNIF